MGLFFKSSSDSIESAIQIALRKPSINDDISVEAATREIIDVTKAKPGKDLNVTNILIGIGLLAGSLVGALYVDNEKASQTLLDCFKILFTAFIGFFGFEASKK
jgi:hypothetical protein